MELGKLGKMLEMERWREEMMSKSKIPYGVKSSFNLSKALLRTSNLWAEIGKKGHDHFGVDNQVKSLMSLILTSCLLSELSYRNRELKTPLVNKNIKAF